MRIEVSTARILENLAEYLAQIDRAGHEVAAEAD
jgi:hypothetical protein